MVKKENTFAKWHTDFLSILHVFFSAPEIAIQVDNTTGVTSQSIYVEWKVLYAFVKNNEKCGEDVLSNKDDLRYFRFVCISQAAVVVKEHRYYFECYF